MSPAFDPFPTTHNRQWVHYINDHFFDLPDLDPLLERLLFRLERFARDKPWGNTTNDELMRQLQCSKNTLADVLKRGEALGWFRRVLITGRDGRPTARLGFVLFRRPTDRPVATDETFDQVVAQMTAEIRRRKPASTHGTFQLPGHRADRWWYPGIGDHGPQNLGGSGPQFLGTLL